MTTPNSPTLDPFADRYSRQVLFPGIGSDGQQLLRDATVAIVGVGATGAASASLLARAGVGNLILIDRDFVEPSNLQRQVLFDEADALASTPKAEAARLKIATFNSAIQAKAFVTDLVPGNIDSLLQPAGLILDCTDNFETRYLLNDYAVSRATPWIYAAAIGAYAATMPVLPAVLPPASAPYNPTACLACIFPAAPSGPVETCETAGILPPTVNLAASLQCGEALKILTRQYQLVRRSLLAFDLWTNERSEVATNAPDPACIVCGPTRRFLHLAGSERPHVTLCGRNSVQIHEHRRPLDLAALRQSLAHHADISGVRSNSMLLRFSHGAYTLSVFADGRALIQGTTDPGVARSLYARFIGN